MKTENTATQNVKELLDVALYSAPYVVIFLAAYAVAPAVMIMA